MTFKLELNIKIFDQKVALMVNILKNISVAVGYWGNMHISQLTQQMHPRQ